MNTEAKHNQRKEFLHLIRLMGQKHDIHKVWTDLFELYAIRISNSVDTVHAEERGRHAKKIRTTYSAQDNILLNDLIHQFTQMLVEQTETGKLADIAGQIYHELSLHNKWKAQFFTPQNVADMMAMISFDGSEIKDHGYITFYEPACGSGVMALAMANVLIERKHCYYRDLVALASDSDLKCAHMCYVQLSLYGIPAIVVHGNSITQEEWSRWYTPMYVLGGWHTRDWKG